MSDNKAMQDVELFLKRSGLRVKNAANADEPTSHPIGSAPDGTRPVVEGSRSAENSADVKKDVPVSVETAPDSINSAGGSTNPLTPSAKATGEDSANETSMTKSKTDDPGTSHPAKAGDNTTDKVGSLTKEAGEIAALLRAALNPAAPAAAPVAGTEKAAAVAAGAQTAEAAIAITKEAAQTVQLQTIIKNAGADAEAFLNFMATYARTKMAAGEEIPAAAMEGGPAGAGMPPPMPGGDAGGMPPPGMDPGAGAGGPPPGAAMPGGDPGAAGAGAPGAGGAGGGLEELVKAIVESGVDIPQLIAALQQYAGAAGGGEAAPAPGGEAAPEKEEPAEPKKEEEGEKKSAVTACDGQKPKGGSPAIVAKKGKDGKDLPTPEVQKAASMLITALTQLMAK
jgi:hypothetical protein